MRGRKRDRNWNFDGNFDRNYDEKKTTYVRGSIEIRFNRNPAQ